MTTGETKCQYSSKDIAQQLNDGIRALDIRVGHNGYLYHGDFYTGVHLNEVIDACINHLKAHNTETILVMLSWEGVGEPTYHLSDYQSWCNSAFTGSRADYWHLSSVIPVLGDVRGKMVLINGDNTGKPGLALGSFIRQNDWDVGHWYQTPNDRANQKYDLIVDFNNRTKAGGNGTSAMLMNCWNKQFNFGVSVEWYADKINGWMWSDKWGTCNYPRGIQSMDFYRGENVNYIINSSVNY
jgi:1-phosphatidylinositol phosphodiesterase